MRKAEIIDLTYELTDSMLVYPGVERPAFSWRGRVNSEGFNLTRMSMIVHTGTHVDAPLHFLPDTASIDEVPLDRFYGETIVFRLKFGIEAREFGADDLVPSLNQLEEGGIFVIQTGIGLYQETAEYNSLYSWPSLELIQALVNKKVRCYMTDATAVDPVNTQDSVVHKALFKEAIPVVENLANLEKIPEGRRFIVSAMPLKLAGREGAPCRAVAIIQ